MRARPDLNRAATMAYRVLAERRITSLPVNPLALLRRCRNTQVMTVMDAAEALGMTLAEFERRFGVPEAMTFRIPADGSLHYIVVYQPDGNPARQRFTLAHELGHRVLAHNGSEPWEEREADCFASHLLCPRPAVALLEERFERLSPEQAASAFYVSAGCARMLLHAEAVEVDDSLLTRVKNQLSEAVQAVREIKDSGTNDGWPKTAERFWKTNA